MRSFVSGTVVGLVLLLISGGMPSADAHHTHSPPRRLHGLHQPTITQADYTQCTSDPIVQQFWAWGPESWEDGSRGFVDVERSTTECSASTAIEVLQAWEHPLLLSCNRDRAIACYQIVDYDTHQNPDHWHVEFSWIAFNPFYYPAMSSDAWRRFISAHEFGHAMSLAEHLPDVDGCAGDNYVMFFVGEVGSGPCLEVASSAEMCLALHSYALRTQLCSADNDGDGCTEWEEEGDDELLGGSRSDGTKWDFFEVTDDRTVDINDAVDVLSYFGDAGTNAAGNHRDRAQIGTTWETVEANDGISLDDAIAVLAQFGHDCTKAP